MDQVVISLVFATLAEAAVHIPKPDVEVAFKETYICDFGRRKWDLDIFKPRGKFYCNINFLIGMGKS